VAPRLTSPLTRHTWRWVNPPAPKTRDPLSPTRMKIISALSGPATSGPPAPSAPGCKEGPSFLHFFFQCLDRLF
jgi:hypothetical protein